MKDTRLLLLLLFVFFLEPRLATAQASDEIQTDRPDFTEASSTVGQGVWQLETGYTFAHAQEGDSSHSFPESLLRVGAFSDAFEFRLAANILNSSQSESSGFEDLYLGSKIFLLDEEGLQPELSMVLQSDLPSGGRNVSASRAQPGVNFLYGWDLNDTFSLGGSSQANRRFSEYGDAYAEYAQSLTTAISFGGGWGMYAEWFALLPIGQFQGGKASEHYLNGGPTWKITKDLQLDARAGVGLNSAADNFFTGVGASFRW